MNNSTLRWRSKITRLLSREVLENLSQRDNPWHSLRKALEEDLIHNWPAAEIQEEVLRILRYADAPQ